MTNEDDRRGVQATKRAVLARIVAALVDRYGADVVPPEPRQWSFVLPITEDGEALLVPSKIGARCRLELVDGWERVAAIAATEAGPLGAWAVRNGLNDWRP